MKKMLATILSITLAFGLAVMPVFDVAQSAKNVVISAKANEEEYEKFDDSDDIDEPFYDTGDNDMDDTEDPSDDSFDKEEYPVDGDDGEEDSSDDVDTGYDDTEDSFDDSDDSFDKEEYPVDGDDGEEGSFDDVDTGYDDTEDSFDDSDDSFDKEEYPVGGDDGEEDSSDDVDTGYDDIEDPSDDEQEDALPDFEYEINDEKSGNITIAAYYGIDTDVVIPEEINGHKVTEIADNCFAYSEITSVTIPETVTAIGDYTFFNCTNLKTVVVPKTVKNIGEFAFGYYESLPFDDTENTDEDSDESENIDDILDENEISDEDELLDEEDFSDEDEFSSDEEEISDEDEGPWRYADFKLYCYQKTAGETYAKNNVLCYALIDSGTPVDVHSYTGVVTKKPTCTEKGVQTFKCTCGENSYTEEIAATGHKFGGWTTAKKATCTTDGKQIRKCSACGKTELKTVKATGHKYTTKVVKPTCTAKGYKLHTCSVCKKSYKDNYTNALGHKYVKVKVVKPTLKSKGYTLYKCSRCGVTIKKNYVPALISITKATVSGIKNTTYTGKQIKPVVKVSIGKTVLKNGIDYTVVYGTNKIGKAVVKILGKGKYDGSIIKTFTISPRKTDVSVKSTVKGKISAIVSNRSEAAKYQIQISSNSKFKGAKTYTVISTNTTLTGTSNNIYYVRVRTVNGSYVSDWSAVKKVKVK